LNVHVVENRDGEVTVLAAVGVIKLGESAREFASHLDRVLAGGSGPVLIDFEDVTYMDSTGLGELIAYLRRFEDEHRKLALVRPSRRIRALLELTRLDRVFDIFESREEGMRFLRGSKE
jgi:anti-anti-sigma factor